MISLRNDFPVWAIPNGGLRLAIWRTFLKLMKIPCAVSDDFLVVGVHEHGDHDPLDADCRLDHVRDVALTVLSDVLQLRRRVLGVLRQVEVAAIRNALELAPADRVLVLDVARAL